MLTWSVTLQSLQYLPSIGHGQGQRNKKGEKLLKILWAKKDKRALMKNKKIKICECIMDKNTSKKYLSV